MICEINIKSRKLSALCISARKQKRNKIFQIICILAIILLAANTPIPSQATGAPTLSQVNHPIIYLPIVRAIDSFSQVPTIWTHASAPASHEVALFKHSFSAAETLTGVEIQVFADTRYELYLNGAWLGRGPARFTRTYREYDRYRLDPLLPGEHTLAVLVQWAPNMRRSESNSPGLQLRLIHPAGEGVNTMVITGAHWLSLQTQAWQTQAADIAPVNLIGPSELLDLRKLPSNWLQPEEDGQPWKPAVVRETANTGPRVANPYSQIILNDAENDQPGFIQIPLAAASRDAQPAQYQPRSIPQLTEFPVTTALLDAGQVHPGFMIGEIPATQAAPFELTFQALQQALFTVEVFGSEPPGEGFIQVDQNNISWNTAGVERPDVYTGQVWLETGNHSLRFNQIPADGLTFAVSSNPFIYSAFPFEQSLHAGRRNLIATLVSDPDSMEIVSTEQGLSVQLKQLPAYLVLDLGRTIHGRLAAEVSGASGAVLDIGWDERLQPNNRPLPYPGSLFPGWNQVDSWVLDGQSRQITTLDSRAGRYILITAWGEAPIQFNQLQLFEERAPLKQSGSLNTSDPRLNQIWQVGVDSLLPNLTDALTDTPWRERGQWWGDAYVADQVAQVSLGETGLLKRGLILMAQAMQTDPAPAMAPHNGGMHLLDYSMLWVHSMADYLHRNTDAHLADQLYPTLVQFMAYLESLEAPITHLIELPALHWSQTAYIDPRCPECRYGQSTPINALYYSTLQQAAQLALVRGDTNSAQSWQEKAQVVKNSLNQQLYLPEEQRYATTSYNGQLLEPGPHAQAWALAYNLVEVENIPAVTAALLELLPQDPDSPNLEIYGMYWVLRALGENGNIQPALEIIERYYGKLLDRQASTWWENFNADDYRFNSLSHAWGGAPTWFLSTYLAGFKQTGSYSFRWQPAFSTTPDLSASAPMGENSVNFSWQSSGCGILQFSINIPAGIQGKLILPVSADDRKLSLDGKTLWEKTGENHPNGIYYQRSIDLFPGFHQITLEQACGEFSFSKENIWSTLVCPGKSIAFSQ